MRSEALEAVGLGGALLRVEFVWRGDRYGHVIAAADAAGQLQPLLESLEGTPTDDFPPSPPLQNLHRETLPDGRAALLLVGAAGRSHWSASIEAASGAPQLIFDIACRRGGEGGWLGCRYLAMGGAKSPLSLESDDAVVTWREGEVDIRPATNRSATTRWRFTVSLVTPDS